MRTLASMRYTTEDTAAIVQWQNAALWQRMSWVRNPLAAPITFNPYPRTLMRSSRFWLRLFTGVEITVLSTALLLLVGISVHNRTQSNP